MCSASLIYKTLSAGTAQLLRQPNADSSETGGHSSAILRLSGQAAADGLRSELLRSMGHAGGHSRAGSVAGWESLEDMEDARSELTSEAGSAGPFWLVPLPYSGLPSLKGRSVLGFRVYGFGVSACSLSKAG